MFGDLRLSVKVLPAHKRALEELAQAEGECVSGVVRRLIRVEAERCGVWATTASHPQPPNHLQQEMGCEQQKMLSNLPLEQAGRQRKEVEPAYTARST